LAIITTGNAEAGNLSFAFARTGDRQYLLIKYGNFSARQLKGDHIYDRKAMPGNDPVSGVLGVFDKLWTIQEGF
jgi:hypothetical protein